MKEYYLIPKELIDSRIEELKKKQADEFCMQDEAVVYFNVKEELQSLTQQSELVKLIDVNELEKTYRKEFDNYSEKGFAVSTMMTHIYRNYKLIKTIIK